MGDHATPFLRDSGLSTQQRIGGGYGVGFFEAVTRPADLKSCETEACDAQGWLQDSIAKSVDQRHEKAGLLMVVCTREGEQHG